MGVPTPSTDCEGYKFDADQKGRRLSITCITYLLTRITSDDVLQDIRQGSDLESGMKVLITHSKSAGREGNYQVRNNIPKIAGNTNRSPAEGG